ncbi:uncharacterized protein (DUF58 family) [Kibdelosporangium banguiense]|uniref:Uncharacterized protein (DUF58 family) n=1 Tax=Kibdelosporangium banguiense TaxID=1365924 RepID=A0ABS4TUK5_9PSEU|nr:DUF58 domain-containing protein [Kibdelosporangium banguiense]MBP2327639.1 uncharacterized protein (DUF58 family) [Kibdelosporangium banguiense]
MAVTGRAGLLALLGALVVGFLIPSWTGIAVVTGVVLLAIVADLALAGPVQALTFTRGGDRMVRLGEPASVTLTITNPGPGRVRGLLRDAWPPSAGAEDRHTIDIRARGQQTVTTALTPSRRGDRMAHRVTVRAFGPLGLAARQGSHAIPWTVRVLPPFTSRRHLPARLARLRDLDGRLRTLARGQGTEFDSLRTYVAGDDVRSIDWRATARSTDVMIRTWRPERDRHVMIVLDTGRTSAGRVGDIPRLDAAMDAALLLAALASRAGDRVDLFAYDRQVRTSVQGSADLLPALVNGMATLEPALVESDASGMVAEILRRSRRRSLVVLLTGLDPDPLEQGLLPVLQMLTSRHLVLLASVADPRIAEMAAARGDAEAVYDAAAAARTLQERQHVAAVLRRRGVEIVDATPDELAPALSDAYLALKAAGRL